MCHLFNSRAATAAYPAAPEARFGSHRLNSSIVCCRFSLGRAGLDLLCDTFASRRALRVRSDLRTGSGYTFGPGSCRCGNAQLRSRYLGAGAGVATASTGLAMRRGHWSRPLESPSACSCADAPAASPNEATEGLSTIRGSLSLSAHQRTPTDRLMFAVPSSSSLAILQWHTQQARSVCHKGRPVRTGRTGLLEVAGSILFNGRIVEVRCAAVPPSARTSALATRKDRAFTRATGAFCAHQALLPPLSFIHSYSTKKHAVESQRPHPYHRQG